MWGAIYSRNLKILKTCQILCLHTKLFLNMYGGENQSRLGLIKSPAMQCNAALYKSPLTFIDSQSKDVLSE